jgi:hypothetical protein
MAGTFIVDFKDELVRVGPGIYTHNELTDIWNHKELWIGKTLKFRYFPHGMKKAPRYARALGLRHYIDK